MSIFVLMNNIEFKNNYLREIVNYNFPQKITLMDELKNILRAEKNNNFSLETLIKLFEFAISPSNRLVNGAVYTPKNIREFIITSIFKEAGLKYLSDKKIVDLSCGCGAFLVDAARSLQKITNLSYYEIFKENIYGIDIEDYAIERTRILLILLALINGEDDNFEFNLVIGNSLTFDWNLYLPSFSGFNIIVGNPPYVTAKHMTKETREQVSAMKTCQVGIPDLYIPFFEIGIENLALNGQLGFITMNSFFKSLNARNLRKYLEEKSLAFKIIDFGAEQVFHSKNTYTCICLIENINASGIEYIKTTPEKLSYVFDYSHIPYQNLDPHNGWNLFANSIIRKIELVGSPLGKKYRTSHGLATLKNDLYIFTPHNEDCNFYYLTTKNGQEYAIEKNICMDVVNSNKLSRKISIAEFKEKLIFPYTNKKNPEILDEDIFLKKYPKAYKYLTDHKSILETRDNGKGQYKNWYAFGRTQGLEQIKNKMFFPKYSDIIPHYLIHTDEETYFYNGQAFLGGSIRELRILKKILETRLFWFYISSTSKPYSANYYSLNGIYIKNFGICELTKEEEEFVLSEQNQAVLNNFFEEKYQVDLNVF
ncbi:class I SAM-dependent DNA methyltransferase [Thiopseudomonas alkaliphila]|uniref:HsdM family class I SAM-dependent methyltransferase n=1 Tax=Thiopseudomonas alkaliphila TaxID=1697053 RepID=UPI0018F40D19|nr:N-6 DNA methylase [Thiopseudomonas alkaliphila]